MILFPFLPPFLSLIFLILSLAFFFFYINEFELGCFVGEDGVVVLA